MIDEQLGLYDIYELHGVPFWYTMQFKVIIGIASTVIVLMALLFFMYRYNRQKKQVPYWKSIIKELEILKMHKSYKENPKYFYSVLTYNVKEYLSYRFGKAFTGRTDIELVTVLKKTKFSPDVPDIKGIFEGITPIKFSRTSEVARKMDDDLCRALSFIRVTLAEQKPY